MITFPFHITYIWFNFQSSKEKKTIFLENIDTTQQEAIAKTQVIYAKTHKTGSSTIQNIIMRFGLKHNLSFAVPLQNTLNFTWIFSESIPFDSSMVLQNKAKKSEFDIIAFHLVWNFAETR